MDRILIGLALVILVSPIALAAPSPTILELYPNPVEYNDPGEYVVVRFPIPTNLTHWTLSDGETTLNFPSRTVTGTVTITTDPDHLPGWIDHPVIPLRGHLQLANSADEIYLYNDGRLIDAVQYTNAPSGHRYRSTGTGWDWQHPSTTNFPVTTVRNVTARVFVLPDNPDLSSHVVSRAADRILLAGYTYASPSATTALCRARERGVRVTVLVDSGPVGGMSTSQREALDALVACNVTVTTTGGDYAWFVFHHAKYAVVDNTALVLTENWKPSGTGGHANRGWGVVIRDQRFANALASVFHTDHSDRAATPWLSTRPNRHFVPTDPPTTTYPPAFPARQVHVNGAELVLAPDNAEPAIVQHLDSATHSIDIQQVTIGTHDHAFLEAAIRAAHRGVTVRILLSDTWYSHADNQALVDWITTYAATEGIPLTARLIDPRSNFEKTHTKGIIIDGETVILGSVNWTNNSVRNNREVTVVLHGEEPASYFSAVFTADWQASAVQLPLGFAAVTLGTVIVSARIAQRSVTFQSK